MQLAFVAAVVRRVGSVKFSILTAAIDPEYIISVLVLLMVYLKYQNVQVSYKFKF